jgi:hemophore-related protein
MRSTTKLVVASGGLALLLTAGAGVASAQPVEDAIINSTCTYPQVVAALNAESPDLAQQLQEAPAATGWLKSLIAAGPEQRRVMVTQARSFPGVSEYTGVITQVAYSCSNF